MEIVTLGRFGDRRLEKGGLRGITVTGDYGDSALNR